MRDRDHSGTDGLTYTDVYFGLVKVVTGADLNDPRDKGDKSKVVSEYKTCVNSKSEYNPFTKESYRSSFNSKYIKKTPPSSRGQQSLSNIFWILKSIYGSSKP